MLQYHNLRICCIIDVCIKLVTFACPHRYPCRLFSRLKAYMFFHWKQSRAPLYRGNILTVCASSGKILMVEAKTNMEAKSIPSYA